MKRTLELLLVLYLIVTVVRYRMQHTGLTETELFLRIPDALLWR